MWYHLTGGRYFFEHWTIPHTNFFSFLPTREWPNYYWLFQVVAYGVYSVGDYHGLIVLRAVAYVVTVLLIGRFFLGAQRQTPPGGWAFVACVLYGLVLLPRYAMVRPQLFTYVFIISFLLLLEFQPRRAVLLPLLGVLWMNLHGIEYPVMLWLCGSYLLEYYLRRLRTGAPEGRDQRMFLISVFVAMLVVFATPYGGRLLGLPFVPLQEYAGLTAELQPITLQGLLSFQFSNLAPSHWTLITFLLTLSGVGVLVSLVRRQARISHLLLWVGAILALTKGSRLINEAVLMTLPVVAANPLVLPDRIRSRIPRALLVVFAALLVIIPVRFVDAVHFSFGDPRRYPLASQRIPEGVATFLNRIDVGGRLLNDPDTGGYLEWELHPRYQIFVDRQVPLLFREEEMYVAKLAVLDRGALGQVIEAYDPSFITVPIRWRQFRYAIQAFPDYAMVFFDDAEVLYVNRRHHPVIAKEYGLEGLDPFHLRRQLPLKIEEGHRDRWKEQVLRLIDVYPDAEMTNALAALIYQGEGDAARAMEHAQAVIRNVPQLPRGYWLLGDALTGLGAHDEAASAYQKAVQKMEQRRRFTF